MCVFDVVDVSTLVEMSWWQWGHTRNWLSRPKCMFSIRKKKQQILCKFSLFLLVVIYLPTEVTVVATGVTVTNPGGGGPAVIFILTIEVTAKIKIAKNNKMLQSLF